MGMEDPSSGQQLQDGVKVLEPSGEVDLRFFSYFQALGTSTVLFLQMLAFLLFISHMLNVKT